MKILVTGGGTGGHIYPALAFVNYVKTQEPNAEFMYVGAKRGLENKIVPTTGIPFHTLEIQGFQRKFSLANVKTIQLFLKSIHQAKKILKEFQPDIVIGTGGYVSGAVVYASAKLGIPTIIHEQNSVPGMTNKFLSRYVDRIALSFKDAATFFPEDKSVLIGNPRAQEVADTMKTDILKKFDLDPEKKTVLIFGGSQGALKINQAVTSYLDTFEATDYQILYASGERYYQSIKEKLGETKANISIQPYINEMAAVMAASDLLVGRAGATSIAELTALGLPAILIPSPYVTNDHQTKNAMSLVRVGAAKMIADGELDGDSLGAAINEIMTDETLQKSMSTASKTLGIPDASERLYQLAKSLIIE
ncbi:undecaprenyldiphospho-muramoylpentapeptide beta-N-acetylglucosaminyltransferase [Enterococcus mundtii]|uniref:UDP-N-acetylglucosamine--N-acetylmuramyl-(pentapeptide) pyrophosphoryl-undecaprenol N-acetylglucosamine transferase n=1 Tax=Enterococcus mundtii TaxID=53346 RepID=A0ABQ0VAR0_ENTMU|nr:undecaprenyldiphospho-muramoylpentapeptide beta-N-acetylglucosaminyltransferase [Enterococcus mundtii]GEN16750.1 UDP-N-acetylglucosamine--N-acetylmuramyl-(pentapeptide) pyrophosphoryl-undecaprenol N-acetylglucosamine transferase [Ligilactobacillus acidipiscis]AUB52073.1 undecaprenyldiphospho-muramoylpentapeptide beta-N-acetylglucosaminyltransferase [Enterococcus mundtii]MZZ57788.1 undecaprenyldiphospho-muramoylpentapeptide beta-N-acetylglucosaminyltransferase [Enterococcus mundtii]MZZ60763.1